MSASLTRNARIRKFVPLAIAQGWGVRRLAREARISYATAGETLRFVQQRAETGFDEMGASLCAASAAEIRGAIGKAVSSVVKRVEEAVSDVGKQLDAAGLQRLSGALETALRIADNLDGLAHLRRIETAMMSRMDSDALKRLALPVDGDEAMRSGSVEVLIAENRMVSEPSPALRRRMST